MGWFVFTVAVIPVRGPEKRNVQVMCWLVFTEATCAGQFLLNQGVLGSFYCTRVRWLVFTEPGCAKWFFIGPWCPNWFLLNQSMLAVVN